MAIDATKNFGIGTLTAGIASGATSLVVGSGEGARFPAVSFNAVVWNSTDYTNAADAFHASQAEIVRVTAIATDTFTITRAQESTTARNLNTGGKTYRIMATLTALTMGLIFPREDRSSTSGTTPTLTFTDAPQVIALTTSGNTTFTLAGMAAGRRLKLIITADAARTLAFAATHTWMECASTGPGSIAISKVMELDFECDGTTAASVRAVYAVQP